MSDHELDLLELAGTHGWRALLAEKHGFLETFRATMTAPASTEFDFIRKEVAAGVVREMTRFFDGIEQLMENLAKQRQRA